MKWAIASDLHPQHQGPFIFTKWIEGGAASDSMAPPASMHVLELGDAEHLTGANLQKQFRDAAQHQVDEQMRQLERPGWADSFEVMSQGTQSVDEMISNFASAKEVDALVIGRHTGLSEDRFVRLGRVVRRVLRRLEGPVVVVPPDLKTTDIGAGPIVVATDGSSDSIAAYHFAAELAESIGRDLVFAHAVSLPQGWGLYAYDLTQVRTMSGEYLENQRKKIEGWAKSVAVDREVPCEVREGLVVESIHQIAAEKDACMVVCGSRKLSLVGRFFSMSVGSELAARLRIPVAVVPPDQNPE